MKMFDSKKDVSEHIKSILEKCGERTSKLEQSFMDEFGTFQSDTDEKQRQYGILCLKGYLPYFSLDQLERVENLVELGDISGSTSLSVDRNRKKSTSEKGGVFASLSTGDDEELQLSSKKLSLKQAIADEKFARTKESGLEELKGLYKNQ